MGASIDLKADKLPAYQSPGRGTYDNEGASRTVGRDRLGDQ
jgi:hypothetical protein